MINKVILIGNVGADPDVQYIKEDQPVAHLRVATSEGGFTRQNGTEVPERTDWHRLTVWGRTAKFCENFVRKGDQVYVEGRIHYSQYQDKTTNETRYSTDIVVDELRKLGRKSDSGSLLENGQQAAQPQPTAAQIVAEVQAEYPSQDAPKEELPF